MAGVRAGETRQGWGALGRWINVPALAAVVLWGAMVAFNKYALAEFPVMLYATLRGILAAGALFALLAARGQPLGVRRADWPRLILAGLVGQGFFQVFTLLGLRYTSATHNILLFSTSPIVGAAVLGLFGRYRPSRRVLAGIALGFLGVVLLVQDPGVDPEGTALFGDALSLIGTLGWVALTVLPRPLTARYGAMLVSAWMLGLSALATLPPALGEIPQFVAHPPSLLPWLALGYGALFGSVVGYVLWTRAAHEMGSTGTLVYVYLEPVVTIALATWFLGEHLTPLQVVGALILFVGVGLAQRE